MEQCHYYVVGRAPYTQTVRQTDGQTDREKGRVVAISPGGLTCDSDLHAEGLLAHDVLDHDGVHARVGPLRGGEEELRGTLCVANGYPLGDGHSVLQPLHLGPRRRLGTVKSFG